LYDIYYIVLKIIIYKNPCSIERAALAIVRNKDPPQKMYGYGILECPGC